tara:strand:- start:336 stop:632 length:297 start_codon:yes stop_codon:yes gene_type:complete
MFKIISKKEYEQLMEIKAIKCANEMAEIVKCCIENEFHYSFYSKNMSQEEPKKPYNAVYIGRKEYVNIRSLTELQKLIESVKNLDEAEFEISKHQDRY